jgi:hypothetical protein
MRTHVFNATVVVLLVTAFGLPGVVTAAEERQEQSVLIRKAPPVPADLESQRIARLPARPESPPEPAAPAAPAPAPVPEATEPEEEESETPVALLSADEGCAVYAGCEHQQSFQAQVVGAYKEMFFDNNFSYLEDPAYADWHLGENLKRRTIGDWMIVDVGGQYRLRNHIERNFRFSPTVPNIGGLTGVDDDFLLHRTRFYVNSEIGDRVRFFGEMLDARSEFEEVGPRVIEENHTDIQNLFLDVVVADGDRGKLTGRVGRQEVGLGAGRLISPLDWANTRRTFEGARLMWQGDQWDIDGLWVRPLRRYIDRLDPPYQDREIYGVYSTYKGMTRDKLELYWLALHYYDLPVKYDTIGSRYYGSTDNWLYELEGGVQFGENADDSGHGAGFFTLGLGRKFDCLRGKPTLWSYYDWASGDDTVSNGFHHYEPLVHKYLGFMDLFGRRNIEDANLLLTLQPHEKLTLLAWYHFFWLQNGNDVPYNVNMSPFANLPGGSAGSRELGQELDLTATFLTSPHTNLLIGYSHFFAGEFYATTPGVPFDGDASFLYTQFTVNF